MSDNQLDEIYQRMDSLFWDIRNGLSSWDEVDRILTEMPVEEKGVDELLAYLTITSWYGVKINLKTRSEFVKKAKKQIKKLVPAKDFKGIMEGLE
jgi:hypothetical protein